MEREGGGETGWRGTVVREGRGGGGGEEQR